jgi:hypothetical protein
MISRLTHIAAALVGLIAIQRDSNNPRNLQCRVEAPRPKGNYANYIAQPAMR